MTEIFFDKVRSYHALTPEAEKAWTAILHEKTYLKKDFFVKEGQTPKKFAFVVKGLFSQYYSAENGDVVTKYFFPEGRIAGSVSATLSQTPSDFTIAAIEDTTVLEYEFDAFKKLVAAFPDIAAFYINYLEKHWVIEKEPQEIALRNDQANVRYAEFTRKYPDLVKRLKKHHIASYLGITPTQLSRILFANK